MNSMLEKISKIGIVPVIKIDDVEKAVPLAKALIEGGIACAEVTFRTKEGKEAIKKITDEVEDILVGAGTVLTTSQVDEAIEAGAKFIVSPGFNPIVVNYCISKNITIIPGCSNPSDVERAIEAGLTTVKFFPAEQTGGIDYIKAISAPYTSITFVPTGGINENNLNNYLAFDKVLACGGSWMVRADLIDAGNFDEIIKICQKAVENMLDFKIDCIHVKSDTEKELEIIKIFSSIFKLESEQNNIKTSFKNNIIISTNSVKRAMEYLKNKGIIFNEQTSTKDKNENIIFIELENKIGNFSVSLKNK